MIIDRDRHLGVDPVGMKRTIILIASLLLCACAGIPVEDRPRLRAELDAGGDKVLAEFFAEDAALEQRVRDAPAYMVGHLTEEMIAALGGRHGIGVLVDNERGTRRYVEVRGVDIGVGFGSNELRVLAIADSRDAVDAVGTGYWSAGANFSSVAGSRLWAAKTTRRGISTYLLGGTGANLSATVGIRRVSINTQLTDVGIGEVSIPAVGRSGDDVQGDDAPRQWPYRLPFLAQNVVNLGYDLPLPYGAGIAYADVRQDQLLTSLRVGFNGSPKEPFEFVSFANARSETRSPQLKVDAWLFPFMNVFALFGRVEGIAAMDIFLDGNGMLDQIGEDCSGPIPSLTCILLQDQLFLLPVRPDVNVTTYGVGTILAGGWNDWFVTVPVTLTMSRPDATVSEGLTLTASPRVGRLINLGRVGNLSVFVGGNYLRSKLEIEGTFVVPGDILDIDYTLDQENADRWNAVVGANWDLSKRVSLYFEYNGFTGSREAYIGGFGYRF